MHVLFAVSFPSFNVPFLLPKISSLASSASKVGPAISAARARCTWMQMSVRQHDEGHRCRPVDAGKVSLPANDSEMSSP